MRELMCGRTGGWMDVGERVGGGRGGWTDGRMNEWVDRE